VGEGTNLSIAEQPGDFGNGEILILQIAPGKIHSQPLEHSRESEPLFREVARERAWAHAEPPGDFGHTSGSMRQERSNRILYVGTECTAGCPMQAGFFAVLDQLPVQIRISAEDGRLLCSSNKCDLIGSAENDIAAHERVHLGTTAFTSMNARSTTSPVGVNGRFRGIKTFFEGEP
jgi:hypothetical protein